MENYVVGFYRKKGLKVGFNEFTDPQKRRYKSAEIRQPGDPVPEALGWKQHVLTAHLNLKWIMSREQYELEKAQYERLIKTEAVKRQAKKKEEPVKSEADMEEDTAIADTSEPVIDMSPEQEDLGFESKTKEELIAMCKERGLTVRGTKQNLIERLQANTA